MNAVLWGVLAYILVQLIIGLVVSRRIQTESDYLLAGRQFGYGMLTMTLFATWFGAETCIGASGEVYSEGLAGARMDPLGYSFCLIFMGIFFAVPLWNRKCTTLADVFRDRFSPGVEKLAVILMAPTSMMWAAAQIRAFGSVISASSELSLEITITLSALMVIVYTTSGGLLADAITDFIQGIVLIFGLLLLLGVVLFKYAAGDIPAPSPDRFTFLYAEESSALVQLEGWTIPIIGSVLSQELVARILAARTPVHARRASLMSAGLYLMVGAIPVLLGLFGPGILPGLEETEQFLPSLAKQMLPTFLYVIFAGALISAILSTVDSALLAAGALVSHNLIIPSMKSGDEKAKLRVTRICVFVFGLMAYYLALHAESVHDLVEEASAFGSTGIFVVIVFGLFTRYGSWMTALCTLAAGIGVYVLFAYHYESEFPYLISLFAATITYLSIGLLEGPVLEEERAT
ncbi:MAG: sodium:solute symporter family protein [Candidatus Omnitrophica bacterium]|nr:sodium:solute symporter family protein [Candidatus Omnitrophota bacterium]